MSNFECLKNLNVSLDQYLQLVCPGISLRIREHPIHGALIRFCPFELEFGFGKCVAEQIEVLRATNNYKTNLNHLVKQNSLLRLVLLDDWPGLGAVRFVPENWETLLGDPAKTELDKLYKDLIETLRAEDKAFICVHFGLVAEDNKVQKLLDPVICVGRYVQRKFSASTEMAEND